MNQVQIHFFDTIGLEPKKLKTETQKAERQEWNCYSILIDAGTHLTPYEVHKRYVKRFGRVSKVSIGRALSCGVKAGIFEKLDYKKLGDWGKPNHQWQAVPNIDKSKIKFK